jgi:putative transposase
VILPTYPADPDALFIDLLPHEARVVAPEGILIDGLRYHSLELTPYVKPEIRQIVRMDPRDISAVYLERPEGGHLRVPWTNQDWPRLSGWEWDEIRARNNKRAKTAPSEVVRQCLAENDRLISERAEQGKLRARRRRARARRWKSDIGTNSLPAADKDLLAENAADSGASIGAMSETPTDSLPPLPRMQLDVTVSSVDSLIEFEVLE